MKYSLNKRFVVVEAETFEESVLLLALEKPKREPRKKSRKREYRTDECSCGWKGKRLTMHQTLTGHKN